MFEYLLPDGTALPENEVIKLAVQKGLTPDDYVKKNKLTLRPKQKKAEVKKEVTKPVAVEKPVVEKVKPAPIEKFNAKQFAKDLGASKGEGFYTKGEKNIEKSGIKIKQLEDKTVQDVFDNFSDLSYTNLSPEEKNTIDDRSVELLSKKYKVGEDYSLSSNDIELKSKELLALASNKKKEIEGETYTERLLSGVAAGLNYTGEMFASIPDTAYRIFAMPQNIVGAITGNKMFEASPEKLKAETGITNPIMDYFISERESIGKKNEIYDNANYDSASITTNLQNGKYTDAFKLLGSGLAESAPVSIGLMMGGAEIGIAKTAASGTALFAGPAVREQKEKKLDESELSTVLKGFGVAGAESVFSAIGQGSLGKVYKDIIKKEGVDVGSKIFKDGLVVAYQTALKKYGAPAAMLGDGLDEVATTVTQNLINEKPAFENVMDSFILGIGGGGVWGAPVNINNAVQGFKDGVTVHQINKTLKDQPVKTIKDVFNPYTPITNAQVNISLIPNAYKILNSQLDIAQNTDEITGEEADAIRKEFAGTYFAANKLKELKLSEDNNAKIANLLKERGALKTKVDAVNDPTLTTIQSNRIKELNVEIEGVIKDNAKTEVEKGIALSEKSILETGEKVYEKPLGSGKSFEVFDTAEEAQSAYDKWADENGKKSEDITKSDGFKLPNGQMLINKERAIEVTALNVAPHELLHNIIDNEFTEPSKAEELKNKFLGTLSKTERDKLDIRILAKNEKGERLYDDEYLKNSPSEYATQFFELVRNGDIKWSDNVKESLIRMWKGIFKPIFEKYGFGNIEFTDGRDVYNFIKDYSKSIEKGTLSTRAKKLLKQGEGVTGVTSFSKTKVDEIQKKIDKLEEQYDKDEIEYDYYENQIGLYEEQLAKAKLEPEVEKPEVKKPKVAVTEEEVVREIIKNEKGTIASDKVQKIYDEKGEQGANEIIKLFKPITAKIVAKRRDAPGFNEEELTKEIELGAGGLFDLIRKFDASKGVPLAAYINKNLPLRAITASRRVLDKEFTSDVEAEVNVRATETADQGMTVNAPEKPKYKNALESNILEPKVLEALTNKIISTVRLLKTRIDAPVTLNRTVTPIIAEIRDDIGKQLDIDIKTMLGGKKDGVLRKELLKSKRYILENMTTTWLMGKDGQGGIPQAIQKSIDGKWVSFPEWVGKKIDREAMSTDLAGRTSGAELTRRLPNVFNNVSNEEFLAQIIGPDGNPIRGRKESVSKAMAEEIAFDIINDDLANDGPIFEAFTANQQRLGVEIASNVVNDFIRQSERGNVKFSKSLMQQLNLNQDELANNISINGKMNLNNIRLALINTFPNWEKEDIEKVAIKLTPSMISAAKQMRPKKKILPKDLLSNVVENVANSFDDGVAMRNKFNSKISVAEFFRNPLYRTDLRTLDLAFSNFVIDKYGKKEGLDILSSLWMPTVAGKTSNAKKAPFSIYDGVVDFNKHLEALQRNTDDGKLIEITQSYKKNNTIFNNNFDGTFNKAKDKLKSDKAKELSILAAEWFSKEILKEDNTYGPEHLAAIYTLFIKENNSALRSAAPVIGTIIDKRIKDIKKYDYDHSKPVSYIGRRLADKFVYGQDVNLDLLFKDYEVTIIPKTVSSKLSKLGLQSMMPLNYTEGSGNAFRISAATTQVVDRYEDFISDIDVKQPIIENAIVNSLSFSKTPKGISVFDFDDTVGLTKGSVLYTMPDDSKGKLNAEEFAKEGSTLLDKGAVFDFSEFSKVVGGKPGPMVDKMKKMIGKFGPENFFILTARPADAAGPIHEFLSSIGIDIPLENITGLGNSTAQAKADWMTGKAAEGYNDFYFADDAPQNVDAVKKALNIPGVDSKVQRAILKFSLTTKVNLDWETKFGVTAADFKVGENNYSINIASTRAYGLGEDPLFAQAFQNIADDLKLPADYLTFNSNVKWVTFSEKTKGFGILNTGNAFEVLGIVTNALSDYANENNLDGIAFDAKEPSRIKLYKTLASTIGSKLGWVYNTGNLKSESGGELFVLTPAKSGALENQPKPVKDVLNVVDVKSPRQQAKIKFSKTISPDFNKILEENVGVKVDEKFSDIVAKRKGAAIGKYRFFVPPSAADLELLTYDFLGYGKKGEEQQRFFNQALFEPYANGIALIDAAKQSIKNDYKALLKAFPEVSKDLGKLTPDGTFTYDQALRVSMWAGMGEEIPGLLKEDITKLNAFVNQDPQLSAFKAGLIATGRQGTGWVTPTEYWDSETIISDLHNITDKVGRKKYLGEFIENSQEMFSKENLNKIETIYGSNFRDALEDSIYSMTNGTNRESGPGRINAAWLNWINNSTGAIMFWNTKSAVLQTIGAINYLNWRDNNPLNAAKAFANQPQYWEDFAYIWNSDKMKERRSGLKEDVSSAEIANAAAGATNKANAVISYLLKKGFLPTQIGDSFAIASGGAPFYRNRVNYNLKQGMTQEEAEASAWKEFVKVTDQTQQSGDPRDISQQQRSTAGRLILAFQNTSMQQARLVKKAGLDLINNRGDAKTNISKIVYYTAVQNIIFGSLQSALFTVLFSDDDDEEKKKKKQTTQDKWLSIGNNIVDTILRGSGLAGAVVATIKNVYLKYNEESKKGFKAEYAKVLNEAANVAPPIGSTFRNIYGAMRTAEFEKDVIAKRGWSVTQDGRLNLSPSYSVLGKVVEGTTKLPLDRFVNKVNNLSEALDSRNKSWQRIALAIGYTPYVIGAKNEENDIIKAEAKVQRKIEGKEKAIETRRKNKEELRNMPSEERRALREKKREEKRKLREKKRNTYK